MARRVPFFDSFVNLSFDFRANSWHRFKKSGKKKRIRFTRFFVRSLNKQRDNTFETGNVRKIFDKIYASRFFKPVDIYLIPFFFCFLLSLNKFEKETLQFFNQDLFIYLFITRNSTHDGQLHRLLTYNNLKEWHYLVRACVRRAYHRSDRTALRESMRWR